MQTLLLADDHDLVRETLADYLRRTGGLHVVCAAGFEEACALYYRERPFGLVLLDYSMPGMDALSGLARMRLLADCPVALLSGTAPPGIAMQALRQGAAGFLPKTLAPLDMVYAVYEMLAGGVYLPSGLSDGCDDAPPRANLTPREKEVLGGIATGKSNREIACDLDIQEVTVKLHLKTLSRKLGARNRTHAAMLARDQGLC